jgi:hypothetical protein
MKPMKRKLMIAGFTALTAGLLFQIVGQDKSGATARAEG